MSDISPFERNESQSIVLAVLFPAKAIMESVEVMQTDQQEVAAGGLATITKTQAELDQRASDDKMAVVRNSVIAALFGGIMAYDSYQRNGKVGNAVAFGLIGAVFGAGALVTRVAIGQLEGHR